MNSHNSRMRPETLRRIGDLARYILAVYPMNGAFMQLGERQFTDGTTRPDIRDEDGRQFVLDDYGEPVYGVWHHSDEYQEPVVLFGPAA
jgi:hypothetical protein